MTKTQLTTIFQHCQELYAYDRKTQDLSDALFSHIAPNSYNPIYDNSRLIDYLDGIKVSQSELAKEIEDYYFGGVLGYNDVSTGISFDFTGEDKDQVFLDYLFHIFLSP